MKTAIRLNAILLSYLFVSSVQAQSDSTQTQQVDSVIKQKPQVKLSLNYNSGLNFYGRTDTFKSSGFFPMLEFWPTSKFYVNAAPIFVNNKVQQFDYAGTVATAGYLNVTKRWITGFYVSKPFYEQNSELVQSTLKLQSGANFSYLNKYVNLNIGGTLNLSDRADYAANAGVDHMIRVQAKNKGIFVFDPSFYAYAGTQNFQRSYLQKTNSGSILFPRESEELITENVSRFNVLSYEASMPIIYIKSKWTFVAIPAYVIPQNLIKVQDKPELSEQGANTFYATLTAKYTF